MSDVRLSHEHSPPASVLPANQDFAALAVSLQEAAQALLASVPVNAPDVLKESEARPLTGSGDGETRSYYFPASALHMEKELLRKYRANDFQGLLEEIYTLLVGQAKLMQSVHKDVRVRGYVISSLGAQLEHAVALVLRMRNVYGKVMPVQK